MAEMTFEQHLEAQLRAYAEGGVRPIDRMAIATAVVAGRARRPLLGRLGWPGSRGARLAAVAGLAMLALGAGWLLGGAQPDPGPIETPRPSPSVTAVMPSTSAYRFIITDDTSPCPAPGGGTTAMPGAVFVDVAAGTKERLLDCEAGLLLSPDGRHAVAVMENHLVLIDLQDGSRTTIPDTVGAAPEAVGWSPGGTYLHWLGENLDGAPTTVFVGPLDDARRTRLPSPLEGGYFNSPIWSGDEGRTLVPSDDGWLMGSGDATDLRAIADPAARVLAMSSDGSRLAVAVSRQDDRDEEVAVDVATGDPFEAPIRVTDFPDGTRAIAAAWSPDDSLLAVVSTSRPEAATPAAPTSNDLWLIARDGTSRRVQLPPADDAVRASGEIRWAPGGAHLAIGWHTMRRRADGLEDHTYSRLILAVPDGAMVPAGGWTSGALDTLYFSPDGASVAYHARGTIEVVELDGSGTTTLNTLVSFGPGRQLVWSP
jgi:hypothetical protein